MKCMDQEYLFGLQVKDSKEPISKDKNMAKANCITLMVHVSKVNGKMAVEKDLQF